MSKILVVEDDRDISELIKIHLTDLQYHVDQVYDGKEALAKAINTHYCVIILDLMLPGLDGISVCQRIREKNKDTLILMLTAKAEEIDKVLGLESGADDYMTKPFSVRELTARVKALLRRAKNMEGTTTSQQKELTHGDLHIDLTKRQVTVREERVELTPKEYDLLVYLASSPGVTFGRDELLSKVWGYEFSGYEHTVNSHINRLRNKIEKDMSEPQFILTTWGVGYRFADNA